MTVKQISAEGKDLELELSGKLEEEGELPPFSASPGSRVTVDLQGWRAMNSIGIREFMAWIHNFQGSQLTFKNCPKFFIDQLNMIRGFIPADARIASFMVPYFSEASSQTVEVLYRLGVEFQHDGDDFLLRHPRVTDAEGNPCELDVIEHKFFAFLKIYKNEGPAGP